MESAEYDKMDRLENSHPWFIAKRNFLLYVLKKYASPTAHILDIGCGTGGIMAALKTAGYEVEGIDPSDAALNYCRDKGLAVHKATTENTEQPDNSYGAVIALDVLEHLADDRSAVAEAYRILKPGGLAIFTVPAHQKLFSNHDKQLHHFRRYGKAQFAELFNNDFEVIKITWLHSSILLPLALKRLINKKDQEGSASDVQEVGVLVRGMLNIIYRLESAWFAAFGSLPWGLSLMAIVKKKL